MHALVRYYDTSDLGRVAASIAIYNNLFQLEWYVAARMVTGRLDTSMLPLELSAVQNGCFFLACRCCPPIDAIMSACEKAKVHSLVPFGPDDWESMSTSESYGDLLG